MTAAASGITLKPHGYSAAELHAILRRYDIGHLHSIEKLRAGSPESPKLIITTDRGQFLLKRRAPGRNDPFKVAFSHELQLHLARNHFPLPHLIGTRDDRNTIVQANGTVYELFEYMDSVPYARLPEEAFDAGRTLALYHKLLAGYQPRFTPPAGSYHDNALVPKTLHTVLAILTRRQNRPGSFLDRYRATLEEMLDLYTTACAAANRLGVGEWPVQIVHADFHAGNLLFHDHRVVGVIDFDSARMQPCIVDLANSALQLTTFLDFSIPPDQWPVEVDGTLFAQFVAGYDAVLMLSVAEIQAIPHLMIEAIENECALSLRKGSSLEHLDRCSPWLAMARNKGRWIREHARELISLIPGAAI